MSDRQINCKGCGKYMGEIRDAKLRKGLVFLCEPCDGRRVALELKEKTGQAGGANFDDIFGDIFGKGGYRK